MPYLRHCQKNFGNYRENENKSNLVSNAVKFTDRGFINIHVQRIINRANENLANHSLIEFKVKDSGIGIPENWRNAIFEKFTRVSPSYKGIYEGHGIGLYIVDQFVKDMNGTIKVESKEQEGSTFTFTLPFKHDANQLTFSSGYNNKSSFVNSQPTVTLKILIVEDNPIAQLMQGKLLTSLGHKVTLVSSGEEAVELFTPHDFDLIFMDLGLPGIQGSTASQEIRKKEKRYGMPRTPIVALTAHISDEIKQGKEMQADMICSKPLSSDKALEIILHFFRENKDEPSHNEESLFPFAPR